MNIRQTIGRSAIGLVAGLAFATGAQSAPITGGDTVIPRSTVDTYYNFSILDGNNPISASGDLTSWSIYAPANASAVELLIYQAAGPGYSLVGQSALETPSAAGGFETFSLAELPVQAGDLVGLYFQGTGSVEFDYTGGASNFFYTDDNSGLANATNFVGSQSRAYSVSVTGSTAVPEPITLSLFGAGLAGAAALRRRKKKIA